MEPNQGEIMARPRSNLPLDLGLSAELTAGMIERLTCPSGKAQAFLRDSKSPGLRVRVTANGAKSFVFESKLNRQTIRRTIGDVRSWTIELARNEADSLKVKINQNLDPRELDQQDRDAKALRKLEVAQIAERATRRAVTFGEAWNAYVAERKPFWSALHLRDHESLVHEGGHDRKRLKGVLTIPGPLAQFLPMKLSDVTDKAVQTWANKEALTRPTRARLALRILRAFFRWCSSEASFADVVVVSAASGKKTREAVGVAKPKSDYLQREQLSAWFTHVQKIENRTISAFLQALLLTGARREELAGLKWSDVNLQWRGMSIRDKVDGERSIPLTPYVSYLISHLPRRNEWVFSSPTSANGRLMEPRIAHRTACIAAGVEVSLHGLRRSFKSLTEWLEVPTGIVAQIQGHKPSATVEKHYAMRPLDLLRVHHEKIEAWILAQGCVNFVADDTTITLKAVS